MSPPSPVRPEGSAGTPPAEQRRRRLAELTAELGAGILGLGIGVLAADYLRGVGLPILLVGLLLHVWGMVDKHRTESREGVPQVWWSTVLYWICWVFLAALAVYVLARRL